MWRAAWRAAEKRESPSGEAALASCASAETGIFNVLPDGERDEDSARCEADDAREACA